MSLKIQEIDYHRNGVSGEGFDVVKFYDSEENREMVAILFKDRGRYAVFDIGLLAGGNITFGENSWRGDHYEPDLRKAINYDRELTNKSNERLRKAVVAEWLR